MGLRTKPTYLHKLIAFNYPVNTWNKSKFHEDAECNDLNQKTILYKNTVRNYSSSKR